MLVAFQIFYQLSVSATSIAGLRHNGENQDSILSHSDFPFFAVADGISSNWDGKFASQTLVGKLATLIDADQYALLAKIPTVRFSSCILSSFPSISNPNLIESRSRSGSPPIKVFQVQLLLQWC